MNELIGQLAEEARLLGPNSRVGNSHEATEKFASLIIEECLCLIDGAVQHRFPASTYVDLIKEHFGVEK